MYFPKNKIKTNLYAGKGEFFYADDISPFAGYYYSLYNGKFFEGKSPTKGNKEIIPAFKLEQDSQISTQGTPNQTPGYNIADNTTYVIPTGQVRITPTFYYPQPSEKDYQIGQFIRYFCKKVNESVFLEINKTDYDGLFDKNPRYVYSLYKPFYLYWYITGDRKEINVINKRVTLRAQELLQLNGLDKFMMSIGGYDKFFK